MIARISKLPIPLIKIVSINGNEKTHNKRLLKPVKCRKVKSILMSILDGSFAERSPRNKSADVSEKSSEKMSGIQHLNVLVAEDNKDNQKVIEKFMSMIESKELKITVTIVKNGKEAVALACKEKFHFILMDIKMPVMNGFESSRRTCY